MILIVLVSIILVSVTTAENQDAKSVRIQTSNGEFRHIKREEWLALTPNNLLQDLKLPIGKIIVAHTDTRNCSTKEECSLRVGAIQKFHMESRGWDDIGYNFLVGGDGAVYDGCDWDKVGSHTAGHNRDSICIALIGSFLDNEPTESQLNATQKLLEEGINLGKIATNYKLFGHNQLIPTESPGTVLYKIIQHWPHWSRIEDLSEDDNLKSNVSQTLHIQREEWCARSSNEPLQNLKLPVNKIIIAHTATKNCTSLFECKSLIYAIQAYHMETHGRDDISYNFLIGGDGHIYDGIGWDKVRSHTREHNVDSICIALIGSFSNVEPTERQLIATEKLIDEGIKVGKIAQNYKLFGHKQLIPTESPGLALYKIIQRWPHWSQINENNQNEYKLRRIGRTEWLAQQPSQELTLLDLPVHRIIIAHTATENCTTQAECTFRVRFIQTFHMESRGWDDIGCNFLVGGDGAVYDGRGWDKMGAHTKYYNTDSICIAFIGTFTKGIPPERQLNAAKKLIEEGIKLGKLVPDYKLYAHRQLIASESPGAALYELIKTWPHWSQSID